MRYNTRLLTTARELRKNMTKEERRLWYEYLRHYPIRFRRQVPFERYVLDFYCDPVKLAIELDGSQHYSEEGVASDRERTALLNASGILVLRFSNTDVLRNLRGVCEEIDRVVKSRL